MRRKKPRKRKRVMRVPACARGQYGELKLAPYDIRMTRRRFIGRPVKPPRCHHHPPPPIVGLGRRLCRHLQVVAACQHGDVLVDQLLKLLGEAAHGAVLEGEAAMLLSEAILTY